MKEEEKQKITKLLIIAGILALFIILGSFIYNNFIKDGGSKTSDKYIIFGNYLVLQKTNTGFKQIENIDEKILQMKYNITNGNEIQDNVSIKLVNNIWYFFDKDYHQIEMPGFKVASHNVPFALAQYKKEIIPNPLDDEYISEFLNNIQNKNTYKADRVISDIDNDGQDEIIYTLSNYSLQVSSYKQQGFMFIVKNDKIVKEYGEGPYTVMEILDLNNDNTYDLIVNKGSIDIKTLGSCYQIYTFKQGKFELVKDCK